MHERWERLGATPWEADEAKLPPSCTPPRLQVTPGRRGGDSSRNGYPGQRARRSTFVSWRASAAEVGSWRRRVGARRQPAELYPSPPGVPRHIDFRLVRDMKMRAPEGGPPTPVRRSETGPQTGPDDNRASERLNEKLDITNVGEVGLLVLFFLPRKREAAFLHGMLTESLRNGAAAHRSGGRGRGAPHRDGRCDRARRRSAAARSREVAAP